MEREKLLALGDEVLETFYRSELSGKVSSVTYDSDDISENDMANMFLEILTRINKQEKKND